MLARATHDPSCYAGADHRRQNQAADPDNPFPANLKLEAEHFPLRKLADPHNRASEVLQDSSMRIGSAGVFWRILAGIVPGNAAEEAQDVLDVPGFLTGPMQVRRVTVRNAPSIINAIFNVRNSWDGSASPVFNGFNKTGEDMPGVLAFRDGALQREPVRIDRASVASQAAAAALNTVEMSYEGRRWPDLG